MAKLGEVCLKCGQPMADGELVVLSFGNVAVEHVQCPSVVVTEASEYLHTLMHTLRPVSQL